jgi:hypothetical protein
MNKTLLVSALLFFVSFSIYGQTAPWTKNGSDVYVSNPNDNVLIGVTSLPSFKLEVAGNGVRFKNPSTATGSYTTFRIQGPNYTHGLEIDFFGNNNITSDLNWSYGGGAGSGAIVNVNPKPLVLGTNNLPRLFIDGTGNVGVGTITPDFKLTVNGKIKAEELQVVVDVPADYVFTPEYNLMSLNEVAKYIEANNHLPNIPSAEYIKENGWQVGEMNNKLLEKVEELTLYLIQLKQENEELKRRIEKLEGN